MASDEEASKSRNAYVQSEAARLKLEDSSPWSKLSHHPYIENQERDPTLAQLQDVSAIRSNHTSPGSEIKQELRRSRIAQAPSASRSNRLDQSQLGDATGSTAYGSIDISHLLKFDRSLDQIENGRQEAVKPITRTSSATSVSDLSSENSYFETFAPKGLGSKVDINPRTIDSSGTSDYGSITEEDVTELETLEREALAKSFSHGQEPASPVEEPELCEEQRSLVDCIMQGNNVFYTGSAGCGKSTVLRNFVHKLRNIPKRVDVVAPTGAAALNIGGCTLQSYIGWGWNSTSQPLSKLKQDVRRKRVRERVTSTDVLVIDEISMVENHTLERLNILLKHARSDDRAFGGIQLIVTGDFCQLPPIRPFKDCIECGVALSNKRGSREHVCPCGLSYFSYGKWAFHSKAWKEADFQHINLETVHRQVDPEFRNILEKVRLGHALSFHETSLLTQNDSNTKGWIQLFPLCKDAKRVNDAMLEQLDSPASTFQSHDITCLGDDNSSTSDTHLQAREACSIFAHDSHRFEKSLTLKIGMPVVLLVNFKPSIGLINGSQGIITQFQSAPHDLPPPRWYEDQDENDYWRHQLRWKAVRSSVGKSSRWPVVLFNNSVESAIFPHAEDYHLGNASFTRAQIPLLPAWAISIHRSQGMTLSRVEVDLAECFEKGQAYVALSRAKSLKGLCVKSMGTFAHGPDPQVAKFLWQNFKVDAQATPDSDPE